MKVLSVGSVPVVKIRVNVTGIGPMGASLDGGSLVRILYDEAPGQSCVAWVPMQLAERLKVGDEVDLLCIPSAPHSWDTNEVLVCARPAVGVIYSRSAYWYDFWDRR